MALLNAFVDSIFCVGFSSERGLTLDSESKNNGSLFTSYLQSSILSIITSDRATYPLSQSSEFIDPTYPLISRLSSYSSPGRSTSSGRSTPSSLLDSGTRTQKQYIIPSAYKDLPHYCFPDGVRATYQPEKEKIHHFVFTQEGKRSYAIALTFQQPFTLKTNRPDDDGVYQIDDFESSTQNTERSTTSKTSVTIDKQETISSPSKLSPTVKMYSKKAPSSYVNTTVTSSYKKSLSPTTATPSSRMGRAKSQDNLTQTNPTSTTSSSGMRKRTGSIVSKQSPINTASSSTLTQLDAAQPFYLPHCVVLISTEPYWTAMQETISIIHDEITRLNIEPCSKRYKKLIQKYAFLACNTPIPPIPWERLPLLFNVTNDQFVITFDPPINPNRSILDLDLSILLLTLNIGKLLDVLAAIFTEQPITFFSLNYSTLVTTLECLLYLIYPLKWTNIYIPLVPNGLRDIYLEGPPGVYIKGAHSRHQKIVEKLNISFTCNLDDDRNIRVPKNVRFYPIPPTKMHRFVGPITQLLEEIKVDRALKNVPTAPILPMKDERKLERQRRLETNQKIMKIFLVLMIDLCGDVLEPIYWTVNSQQISPTNTLSKASNNEKKNVNLSQTTAKIPIFSKEKYLRPKTEGIEFDFYRAFIETTAFQYLLKEEMTSISPTGFKQICQIDSLPNEDQFDIFNNTSSEDIDNNQFESTNILCDSLSTQMLLPLPDWPSNFSTHYLDICIELFTDELKRAQQERSLAAIAVYAYLRGCARLARGEYLEGLRDLYLIENSNLFPQKYIETDILPLLANENLLELFLKEPYYIKCPEWKKVRQRRTSQTMSIIDLQASNDSVNEAPVQPSPDVFNDEYIIVENNLTYQQFSDYVHRLSIILDKETTETLFKALLYWTDNSITKTLKRDKRPEPIKPANKSVPIATAFTLQETLFMLNDPRRKTQSTTSSPILPPQPTLPTALFELFLDIWQQTNVEKIRMNRHLPEDRQKQESILKVSSSGIASKNDGPGQLILTQKRLYFLLETRSLTRLLTELINIIFVDKYQHQSGFSSSKPGIKIYTSSTSSLPRDNNLKVKLKSSAVEKQSKSTTISLYFKTNQEQDLWYTIIFELWSGLQIAYEQCDTAVLNKASRHIALMDTLSNIDYYEETTSTNNRQVTNYRQKFKQDHNEACLEMALKDLSTFTRMRQNGTLKPLSDETRNGLIRRLSPSINETECHTVRCLIFTEDPDTGHWSLWCAYGSKLKIYNVTTWTCDPNDLDFPSLITCICLDARNKLWVRCIKGELFVVDTKTCMYETELKTNDGKNCCQTIAFDRIHNHILTANRNGLVTIWNASNWNRLYDINLLEIYRTSYNIQQRSYINEAKVILHTTTDSSNFRIKSSREQKFSVDPQASINPTDLSNIPSSNEPDQIIPSSTDKLERIQIYENLLFACYHDNYIIILRIADSNTYTYEDLISVKYKKDESILIDSFIVYNKQLWVSTGCIISIFNINNTDDENAYNLLMKTSVDDDKLITMLGFSGYIWAGSLKGNVYVFSMDNYEIYKTFAGHRHSVWCLCSRLDMYVASGSGQNDTSIAIWENVQTKTSRKK